MRIGRCFVSFLLASLVGAGCAHVPERQRSRVLYAGDRLGEPQADSLPELDVERDTLTEQMRFAWLLFEEALQIPDPQLPTLRTVASIQQWADSTLVTWLHEKNERVVAARAECDRAAQESHRQRIVAGAMVGLLYEDVARVLAAVPVPEEIESDPEIAQVYHEVVEFQASTYVNHALRAYRACSLNATQPAGMRHWAGFCAARMDGLARSASTQAPRPLRSGESEVTVLRTVE